MIEHHLVKAILTEDIVLMISRYYQISESKALESFYRSQTATCLADEKTGLYGQSALYLTSMYILEKDGDIDKQRLHASLITNNEYDKRKLTIN